jgi:general secretion pathway protein K
MRLQRQRGVAVITALLLTTLAVSIVASLFWQQQVQVRSMENQRLHQQTKWILRGALGWATLVLRQDGYDHRDYTWLTHAWATPLAETRLDQYIERERVEGEHFDATLSGNITDATSRYNLTNLAANGQPVAAQVAVFARLLQTLQLNQALAQQTANAVADGQPLPPPPVPPAPPPQAPARVRKGAPIPLLDVDDLLAVPGMTPAALEKLRPFVIVLPEPSTVNVNTAAPEVLAAVVPGMSLSDANALAVRRKQAPWRDMANFQAQLNGQAVATGVADVRSEYFLVHSRVRLDRAALDAESLIYRPLGPGLGAGAKVVWIRQN